MLEKINVLLTHANDFETLSPLIQDAIVSRRLMAYDEANKHFCLHLNRFCWEHFYQNEEQVRVLSCLHIDHVNSVQQRGFTNQFGQKSFNLLTLMFEENTLHFMFSDHREIKLELEDVNCHMWDYQEHWPASNQPKHVYEYMY